MLPCYAQNWMDQRPQQPAVLQWKIPPVSTGDAALQAQNCSTFHCRTNAAALAGLQGSSLTLCTRGRAWQQSCSCQPVATQVLPAHSEWVRVGLWHRLGPLSQLRPDTLGAHAPSAHSQRRCAAGWQPCCGQVARPHPELHDSCVTAACTGTASKLLLAAEFMVS